jgi:hypothetical protein
MVIVNLFQRRKAKACIACRQSIRRDAWRCEHCGAGQGPRLCVICAKEIPHAALQCTECHSYQSTRRRFFFLSSTNLAWITAVFVVMGNLFAVSSWVVNRQSHTSCRVARSNSDSIFLQAWNSGRKPSALNAFRLTFPAEIHVNPTVLRPSADADTVVGPNGLTVSRLTVVKLCAGAKPGGIEYYTQQEIKEILEAKRPVPLMAKLEIDIEESCCLFDLVARPRLWTETDRFPTDRIKDFITGRLISHEKLKPDCP